MQQFSEKQTRKVTISLPGDLVAFADQQARQQSTSRSRVIAEILAHFKAQEEERLAAEGYQFYAQEALEFAKVSERASAEVFARDSE